MAVLGTPVYGVTISEPTGRVVYQNSGGFTGWEFHRELCEPSTARLEVPFNPTLAGRLEPWLHVVTFYADEDPVWHGVVMQVEASAEGLVVEAVDGAAFFQRRRLSASRRFDQQDAARVMSVLVEDAMSVGDPLRVVDNMRLSESRVWVVVDEVANTKLVSDVLDDLAEAGLQWTFMAGTLLIGSVMAGHTTAMLSDRHLTGGVTVVKDGKDIVTDVLVQGEGTWAQRAIGDDRLVVQSVEKSTNLKTEEACEARAEAVLLEQGVGPLRVEVDASPLSPEAPVGLNELVPGVRVPVSSSQTGIPVGVVLMVESMSVSDGLVTLTLGVPNAGLLERDEYPPEPSLSHQSPYTIEQADKQNKAGGRDKEIDADWVKPGKPLG